MSTDEDKRSATSIHAGISSQILAASLVLIGVLLGYYDLKNMVVASAGGIMIIMAIVLLMISFVTGGYGLKKLRNHGYEGNWDYKSTHMNFRIQTWLNYLAIVLFIVVFFLPGNQSTEIKELEEINMNLKKLIFQDSIRSANMNTYWGDVNEIKNKLNTSSKPSDSSSKQEYTKKKP